MSELFARGSYRFRFLSFPFPFEAVTKALFVVHMPVSRKLGTLAMRSHDPVRVRVALPTKT